ncbi:NAD(P)/FAD-dependent oxidoreductase [Aquitalea sp. LB_tupeE]|uniref:NAD(P)/FAD-dependent oxidoreductase n=1 Tax=Aquitalea sp. LB_tupeE TaxID=2748078 RepID=UPI0015BC06A7|nr:NAD(P)/FAD-dependent oxidoreductase [Aquitalea sp. LB_tupeE]NWK78187.1 NAD(P)/FAD-dependent oxidoreductase [Aquitalea sp. LB_tupeE]
MFDVAIIGAGVVGCAVARRFAIAGARVVLLEKGADILSGASKANSAILHTGFDAPADSLEWQLVQAGRAEYLEIHQRFNLPLVKTGALVCAWDEQEASQLEHILREGRRNGLPDLTLLSAAQARSKQPGLSPRLQAAVEVAGEYIIDPWSAPLAYVTQALQLGARVMRSTEVLRGEFDGHAWQLHTNTEPVRARVVINAAGLFGDEVERRLGLPVTFQIKPRKGQFVVLDKAAAHHVDTIILPVPSASTKGIVVCPTVFGNVIIGPTAEEQDDRVRATVEHDTLQALIRRGEAIVPALAGMPVTAVYAGLRPATEQKAYRVFSRPAQQAITLGGIRSTGLSAALGLAQYALALYQQFDIGCFSAPKDIPWFAMPNLAESGERDWQRPNHGEMVCHCELVTRREIAASLCSLLPPGDFGGLRRRTRAGMGRCQGFYCNGTLAEMTKGKWLADLAVNREGQS